MEFKIFLTIATAAVSIILFYFAAGTLKPTKLNLISYIFYLFSFQFLLGASLVFLGDRNHYISKYVLNSASFDIMYYCVMSVAIALPLTIIIIQKLVKVSIKSSFDAYLKSDVIVKNSNKQLLFLLIVSGCVLMFFALYYIQIYRNVGYFPIFRLIRPGAGFNIGVERQKINNISFLSSTVTNIILQLIIPILSYTSFTYALCHTKFLNKKSKIKLEYKTRITLIYWALTAVLIVTSLLALTASFEKSPIIFYLFVFLLIITYKFSKLPLWLIAIFAIVAFAYFGYVYLINGLDFSTLDIYNGPFGRFLFTEVGTLTLHFDLFPTVLPFLAGRSFSPTAMKFLSIDGNYVRSGKAVMDFYGSDKVYDGTGGVMNTLFIGESYANFGFIGMALSIIYIAALLTFFMILFIKLKKTPFNIAVFAFLTNNLARLFTTGFTDYIYNFQIYLIMAILLIVNFAPKFYTFIKQKSKLLSKA